MGHRRQEYTYLELQQKIQEADHIPCREVPEIFFPDDFPPQSGLRRQAGNMAKNLCKECPIILDCLLYAVTNKEQYGVWGGTLPNER